jgi:hypothetical protein
MPNLTTLYFGSGDLTFYRWEESLSGFLDNLQTRLDERAHTLDFGLNEG